MVTVYTLTYNEELLIQFMIDHYRSRFPGCRIVVYDNMSTDDTVKIARAMACEIVPFDTNNQIQDRRYIEIKNNCWKDALTDWVLICDLDELLDISEAELEMEASDQVSIIKSEGYEMINMEDNLDIAGMKYGVRDINYDKPYLFSKKLISEINYLPGSHGSNPTGTVRYSDKAYKLYHYSSINEELTIQKRKIYGARLSQENLKEGWGLHYLFTPDKTTAEYVDVRGRAIKIRQ